MKGDKKSNKITIKCMCAVFLALEDDEGKNNDGISFSSSTGPAWAGSERDYTYDEVRTRLLRFFVLFMGAGF